MTDVQPTHHDSPPAPVAKPERVSAVVIGLLAAGFSVWVLTTLPIQAIRILSRFASG